MTEQEIAVIQAAMDLAEWQCAVDCGVPLQDKVVRGLGVLVDKYQDLSAEHDGRWEAPEPPQDSALVWKAAAEYPPRDERPGRQFIRIVGTRWHSGVMWKRVAVGVACTHNDGPYGYNEKDIDRLLERGDIDPGLQWDVTHWMPFRLPHVEDGE